MTKRIDETTKVFSVSRPTKEWEEMVICSEFVCTMTNGKKGLSEFIGFLFDFWKTSTLGSEYDSETIRKLMDSRAPNKSGS